MTHSIDDAEKKVTSHGNPPTSGHLLTFPIFPCPPRRFDWTEPSSGGGMRWVVMCTTGCATFSNSAPFMINLFHCCLLLARFPVDFSLPNMSCPIPVSSIQNIPPPCCYADHRSKLEPGASDSSISGSLASLPRGRHPILSLHTVKGCLGSHRQQPWPQGWRVSLPQETPMAAHLASPAGS